MKENCITKGLFFLIVFLLTGCVTFSPLPDDFNINETIDGIYSNDPCINPFGDYKLWDFINFKSSLQKDGLFVRLTMLKDNRLQVRLLDDDQIIAEEMIKIKRKEDNCFYTRKVFYVIPILPVLWFFSNVQARFIVGEKTIILEETSNKGGAVIFMAGGSKHNASWEFEKKQ